MDNFLLFLFYGLPIIFLIVGIYNAYKYVTEIRKKNLIESFRYQSDKINILNSYLDELNISVDLSDFSSNEKFSLVKSLVQKRINRHLIFSIASIFAFLVFSAFEFTFFLPKGAPQKPEDTIDRLVMGKIAYDIPDTMKLEQDYRAVVSITQAQNDSVLLDGLNSSDFEIKQITISSRVKASLIDPTKINFDINPLSTEEQLVDDSSNTTWRWNIKPKISGRYILLLKVSIKIKNRLGETPKDILVFEKPFFVESSVTTQAKNIFSEYWQWFTTVLFIPLFLLFRNSFLTRQKNKKNKREPIGFKKSGT